MIEGGKKPDITLKEAVRYVASAWKSLSASTIANCWQHTGIVTNIDVINDCSDPVANIATLLATEVLQSPDCTSAASYVNADEVLETEELPTDDDIIAMMAGDGDMSEDDDDDDDDDDDEVDNEPAIPTAPTISQAIEAARLLQNYFDTTGDEDYACKM